MTRKTWNQPLFWCWLFVVIWASHVLVAAVLARWDGLAIALFGLLGAVLVTVAVTSRRRKNLYPRDQKGATHTWPS